MKLILLCVGKTDMDFVEEANNLYLKRLKHYLNCEVEIIPEQKVWRKLGAAERKKAESDAIMKKIGKGDMAILLDENGKEYSSTGFADFLQKKMNAGHSKLIFIVGGAYGFSDELYKLASSKLSLSKMTFSHQMVRCFFLEQVYRAMTILKGEPYHNS